MAKFTPHKNRDTVVVRKHVEHTTMTIDEFEAYLEEGGYTRSPWHHLGGTHMESSFVWNDGHVHAIATRLHNDWYREALRS